MYDSNYTNIIAVYSNNGSNSIYNNNSRYNNNNNNNMYTCINMCI